MDLIHADHTRTESGCIISYSSFSAQIRNNREFADNTWELVMPVAAWRQDRILRGHFVYVPGTEFGGEVQMVQKNTGTDTVTIKGACWRAMLAQVILIPPYGHDAFVIDGCTPDEMLTQMLTGQLDGMFEVEPCGGTEIINAEIRYKPILLEASRLLFDFGYSLSCVYNNIDKRVRVSARPIVDYSGDRDLSPDSGVNMDIVDGSMPNYNHALSRGYITVERWLYNGSIYEEKPDALVDAAVRTILLENSGSEAADVPTIRKETEEELLKYAGNVGCTVDLSQSDLPLQLDDKITVIDRDMNIFSTKSVSQLTLTIDADGPKYETEVV